MLNRVSSRSHERAGGHSSSAWYLTLTGPPRQYGEISLHRNRFGALGLCHIPLQNAVFATQPRHGDVISRLWQGRHSSRVPLLARPASTPGLRRKSVDGREQVSLSPALSSRPKCRNGAEACGGRSDSFFLTSRLSVMASRLMSLSRGSCAYNTVYSVVKRQRRTAEKRPSLTADFRAVSSGVLRKKMKFSLLPR